MVNRFTLAAIAAAFALTGCAKHSTVADFATGETLVTVTHVPAPSADGTTVFVTVDGKDAGALVTGQSVAIHVPAGQHQIGGYARSLIGRVTIPPVQITTTPDGEKRVAYTVIKSKPTFTELSTIPKARPQAPQTQATTSTPETTQTPATAQTPETSQTPAATSTPETTQTPATTSTPETTQTPATTSTPETTQTPATTSTPETTQAPATTQTPDTTPTPAAADTTQTSQG